MSRRIQNKDHDWGEVVQVLIKMVSTNEKLSCTNTEGKISKKFERKMPNPQWDF